MSLESHIESLNQKISNIEDQIHDSYVHHLPTAELKKEKLHLLDEIEQLTHGYHKQNAA